MAVVAFLSAYLAVFALKYSITAKNIKDIGKTRQSDRYFLLDRLSSTLLRRRRAVYLVLDVNVFSVENIRGTNGISFDRLRPRTALFYG